MPGLRLSSHDKDRAVFRPRDGHALVQLFKVSFNFHYRPPMEGKTKMAKSKMISFKVTEEMAEAVSNSEINISEVCRQAAATAIYGEIVLMEWRWIEFAIRAKLKEAEGSGDEKARHWRRIHRKVKARCPKKYSL